MKFREAPQAVQDDGLSYEESKRLARDENPVIRANLAERDDIRPEILYYLAEDDSAEVRRKIAANHKTPRQADLILANDDDDTVRQHLASKITTLLPELDADAQVQAQQYLIEMLETLAKDQVTRVRQILAETLKDLASAPPHVIHRLVRDADDVVACPVLEFSPLLSDQELLDIIHSGCVSGRLTAISRRSGVGEQVTDAIVASNDEGAISALLANGGAQICEETLDHLVDAAVEVTAWHEPLVARPQLPNAAARKLAGFVATSLLDILSARDDLDQETARKVASEVRRRIDDDGNAESGQEETAEQFAQRLFQNDELNTELLTRALNGGDRDLVRHGLALRAGLPVSLVDHILSAHSAKGVTALAWKAGCPMRFASQLQIRLGGIAPSQVINPRNGLDYPLSAEEMDWQLDFFLSLAG